MQRDATTEALPGNGADEELRFCGRSRRVQPTVRHRPSRSALSALRLPAGLSTTRRRLRVPRRPRAVAATGRPPRRDRRRVALTAARPHSGARRPSFHRFARRRRPETTHLPATWRRWKQRRLQTPAEFLRRNLQYCIANCCSRASPIEDRSLWQIQKGGGGSGISPLW